MRTGDLDRLLAQSEITEDTAASAYPLVRRSTDEAAAVQWLTFLFLLQGREAAP